MSKIWNYPAGGPLFSTAKGFKVWIVGSWFPANGLSAAAWRIDPIDGDEPPIISTRPSKKAGSDSWRATSGGICTAINALPKGATAQVFCSNEAAVLLLQKIADNPTDKALLTASRKNVEGDEIWRPTVTAIRENKLTITAFYVPPNDPESRDVFRQLKRLAKEVAGLNKRLGRGRQPR